MSFTAQELTRAGLASLNNYMKNTPIDQIAIERPFLRKLYGMKKSFGGGQRYVVENLRYRYQSNFQFFRGDDQVSYNKRSTVKHSQFEWTSAHDGYSLSEDDFFQNGIVIADSKPKNSSDHERVKLFNLFTENNDVLREGFEEAFDQALLRDGTQDDEAIAGLDSLITLSAGATVGTIDSSSDAWWENNRAIGTADAALIATMETQWRKCVRNGGRPDFIMAGQTFIDTFRAQAKSEISRYSIVNTTGGQAGLDPSVGPMRGVETGLHFQQVPIVWNPVFEDLDVIESGLGATHKWEKRCYFINCKYIRLRPAEGHDMVTRNPPRVYDRYTYYWGLTWKGAMCTSRRNAHSLITLT